MNLAGRQNDPILAVEANYSLGVTMFWLGNIQESRGFLQKSISLYDPQKSNPYTFLYSHDPKVICLSRLAFNLWCLGYPAQAADASQLALNYSQEIGQPYSSAYASTWDVFMLIHMRNYHLALDRIQALVRYCREYQLRHFLFEGLIFQGWLQAEQGETEAGIAMIQDNMALFQAAGAEFKRPLFLSLLAVLLGRQGKLEQGRALMNEGHKLMEKTEERWCQAEILRWQGELLAMQMDELAAEEAFQKALLVARNQQARMLELRAGLGLGRLWLRQGKISQIKQIITPLYGWFTEGLNTPDLQDARLLLAETELKSGN
jgi:predicted ATPase